MHSQFAGVSIALSKRRVCGASSLRLAIALVSGIAFNAEIAAPGIFAGAAVSIWCDGRGIRELADVQTSDVAFVKELQRELSAPT